MASEHIWVLLQTKGKTFKVISDPEKGIIEVINEKLYQSTFYYGRRAVVVHTIGGIDMALWDIAGKYYKQPVYQLLGGAFHKRLRAYASDLFGRDGKETRDKAKKWVDRGFPGNLLF